ncbi:hypothetical protein D3C80_2157600 [compost metagenome]
MHPSTRLAIRQLAIASAGVIENTRTVTQADDSIQRRIQLVDTIEIGFYDRNAGDPARMDGTRQISRCQSGDVLQ